MGTTNLIVCSRAKECGKVGCEHYKPHIKRTMMYRGKSICDHDSCQGKHSICTPVVSEASWEV